MRKTLSSGRGQEGGRRASRDLREMERMSEGEKVKVGEMKAGGEVEVHERKGWD